MLIELPGGKGKVQTTTTIFVSGSRTISRLNDAIRGRIGNMIAQGFRVIVGDANGADKAMQSYLADRQYHRVTVYCSGDACRNNVGLWDVQRVDVDSLVKGREFYIAKDKAMAQQADYAMMIWDGKSPGTYRNVLEMSAQGKPALVYLAPKGTFHSVVTAQDAAMLMGQVEARDREGIRWKLGLGEAVVHGSERAAIFRPTKAQLDAARQRVDQSSRGSVRDYHHVLMAEMEEYRELRERALGCLDME